MSSNPSQPRLDLRGVLLLIGLVAVAALEIWGIFVALAALSS